MRHLTALWGPWWPLPGGLFLVYVLGVTAAGDFRVEHGAVLAAVLFFAYTGPRTKRFLVELAPFVLVGVGYDLVRYARRVAVTPDRVMSCSLQHLDRALFPAGGGRSVQEWLAAHPIPALDVVLSVPYAIFVYVAFVYAAYLFFVDRPRMRRYLWSFAIANYVSFSCWLLMPAAPPWYVHQFGCVADMAALPSPAGLARVDGLLGIHYFSDFYSRTASVYGAMPSMHNAYPLIGLLTAWNHAGWRTRPVHLVYFLMMFTASLYFDHHWVVDAVAGWLTAMVAVMLAGRVAARISEGTQPVTRLEPAGAE
jgi:hypothetical protein